MSAGKNPGVVKAKIDGVDYGTLPNSSLELGDDTHTPVIASGKHQDTFATPGSSRFSGGFSLHSDNDEEVLRKAIQAGAAFEFEMDNGKKWAVSSMRNAGTITVAGEGAGLTCELTGPAATAV